MKKVIISPYARKYRENRPHPKNYPYFEEVINELKKYDIRIIQVGVEGEKILNNVDDVYFNLSLADLLKLLKTVDTFISVDSFFQHFAAFYKIPGIVIFSQSDPNIFGHEIHTNLLKDRKYLRPDQFGIWESVMFNDDAFVDPSIVVDVVKDKLGLSKVISKVEKEDKTITSIEWQPFLLDQDQISGRGIKLHLGCGSIYLNDFINIDINNSFADISCDVKNLNMFRDNTVQLILASHILEHFNDDESFNALKEWYRVLRPGGWLVIEMPDIEKCFKIFLETEDYATKEYALIGVYGRPDWDIYNVHYTGYWPKKLYHRLRQIGFRNIIEKRPKEDNTVNRNMRFDAQK